MIQYKMAKDRRPILTTFADKAAVRSYVHGRVGSEILSELYALAPGVDSLDFDSLPRRFVLKPTHGSGAAVVVDDRAHPQAVLPLVDPYQPWGVKARVHPDYLDLDALRKLTGCWLASNYWRIHGLTQWAYKHVPPQLMVEELLEESPAHSPPDYRFFCINGRVVFVTVDSGWAPNVTRSIHRPDWTPIEATIHWPRPVVPAEMPPKLEEMIRISENLALGQDIIRIDLYSLRDRIVFGEMTNYHAGGTQEMLPEEVFTQLASGWSPAGYGRCES